MVVENNEPYLTKIFDLEEPGLLKVSTPAGNIEVIGSDNSEVVRVELYVQRSYRIWSSSASLDNFYIHIHKNGNEIQAVVEHKNRSGSFGKTDNISFSFKIFTPNKISSELNTRAGNIAIRNLSGSHYSKTGAGNLTIHNIHGTTKAFSAAGNTEIMASKGEIMAMSHGGNITIENSTGELRIQTKAGNIIGSDIGGAFLAKSSAGNIRTHFTHIEKGVQLQTQIGNISADIPRRTPLDVVMEGSQVTINNLDQFEGEKNRGYIHGTINGGGTIINMSATMGNVTLNLYE